MKQQPGFRELPVYVRIGPGGTEMELGSISVPYDCSAQIMDWALVRFFRDLANEISRQQRQEAQ